MIGNDFKRNFFIEDIDKINAEQSFSSDADLYGIGNFLIGNKAEISTAAGAGQFPTVS